VKLNHRQLDGALQPSSLAIMVRALGSQRTGSWIALGNAAIATAMLPWPLSRAGMLHAAGVH